MRRICMSLVPALLLGFAGPAQAQAGVLERSAEELRRQPVYVDGFAERQLSASAVENLKSRIGNGQSPIFVAILPGAAAAEAGGDVDLLPSVLANRVGLQGTYAVVAGNSFRAASNVLPTGRAGELATSTFQAQRDAGTEAVLTTFVDRVNQVASTRGGSGSPGGNVVGDRDSGESRDGGGNGTGLLVVLGLAGGGLFLWSRSRRRRERQEDQQEFQADRQMLQAELSVLGTDVLQLESEVAINPEARADYDAGVTRYQSAQAAMEYADEQVDLVRVERVIDEGRYAMARARARIEGREPPGPPENLARPGRHDEPALELDERREPVYVGYSGMPWYGGGWFGGGGGLLTGLLVGSMFGGGFGGGWGHDHGHDGGDSGGDWGGDLGGGDWGGGGDFGGGGSGGGDVGGGDW